MQHEDGYCDRCGAEVDEVQLTALGEELCAECVRTPAPEKVALDARRGAYDDGR